MNEKVPTELVFILARYAGLPLSLRGLEEDRAEALARILGPALANLRAMRPEGYENKPERGAGSELHVNSRGRSLQ